MAENARNGDRGNTADVIVFTPAAELDAKINLASFIEVCRDRLTVFGVGLPFDADSWDVTDAVSLRANNARTSVCFTVFPLTRGHRNAAPMAEPFKSFAKSYVRYQHAMHPTKAVSHRLAALRALYMALSESDPRIDPTCTTRHTLNRAAQIVSDRFGRMAAYATGQQLELLARFLDDHRLVVVPLRWHSNIRSQQNLGRVGAEFDEARRKKLPSAASLNATANIFRMAESPSDVVTTSVCAILCAAPSRVSEVCHLDAQCEVTEAVPSTGETAFGLRWRPSKGGEAMIKWCTHSMTTVVQEAVAKIRRVTEEARCIARWYEQHPTSLYLPPHREHLRLKDRLTYAEVCDAVFLTPPPGTLPRFVGASWCRKWKVTATSDATSGDRQKTVAFADVERAVLGMLPRTFPFANKTTGLKFSDALLVTRRCELDSAKGTYQGVIQLVDVSMVRNRLCGTARLQNIFQRFGFAEDDGSIMRITTHQFRHYLNTLAQCGGLSELDIAKWSGRVNVSQNAVYNHQSDRDVLALVREAVGDETRMFGPLAKMPAKALIPRDQFANLKVQTAHTTEFGYCIHDFTMLPCQVHRDCMNCDEQVCIKGDLQREEAIKHCRSTTRALLNEALAGVACDEFGANRWVEHQTKTLERLDQLCGILDDPKVPIGAVIQPAGVVPPSKLEQAAVRRLQLDGAAPTATARRALTIPLQRGEAA